MAYSIVFTDSAMTDLDSLDKKTLFRIIKKLKWLIKQEKPLTFAKQLKYNAIGQYRFRIGDYRVIFDYEAQRIIVLRIGHRSTIYR